MDKDNNIISAAVFLFAQDENGEWNVLCGRRSGNNPRFKGGMFDVPCGMREPGESIINTALRELQEEAGISLSNNDIRFIEQQPWGNGKVGSNFLGILDECVSIGNGDFEHDFFKWIPVNEVENYNWAYGMGGKIIDLFKRFVININENYNNRLIFMNNMNKNKIYITESRLRQLINEAIEEAADDTFSFDDVRMPDNTIGDKKIPYEKREFWPKDSFKGMNDYCRKHCGAPIGAGSSRTVYQIDDNRVIKVANSAKGVAQNKAEARCYEKSQGSFSNLFPKIYNKSEDGLWLDCEFVLPAEERDFIKCTKYDWYDLEDIIKTMPTYDYLSDYGKQVLDRLVKTDPFIHDLWEYIVVNGAPFGDVRRLCNWGMTQRNGKPCMVLLDSGLTWDILSDFYWNARS